MLDPDVISCPAPVGMVDAVPTSYGSTRDLPAPPELKVYRPKRKQERSSGGAGLDRSGVAEITPNDLKDIKPEQGRLDSLAALADQERGSDSPSEEEEQHKAPVVEQEKRPPRKSRGTAAVSTRSRVVEEVKPESPPPSKPEVVKEDELETQEEEAEVEPDPATASDTVSEEEEVEPDEEPRRKRQRHARKQVKSKAGGAEKGKAPAKGRRKSKKGNGDEEEAEVGEDGRCKRSDGKSWRCKNPPLYKDGFCKHHFNYYEKKKSIKGRRGKRGQNEAAGNKDSADGSQHEEEVVAGLRDDGDQQEEGESRTQAVAEPEPEEARGGQKKKDSVNEDQQQEDEGRVQAVSERVGKVDEARQEEDEGRVKAVAEPEVKPVLEPEVTACQI